MSMDIDSVDNRILVAEFIYIYLENIWFQQDPGTPHFSNDIIELLKQKFPGRIISRNGDIDWPARLCDLTSLKYFLWVWEKSDL